MIHTYTFKDGTFDSFSDTEYLIMMEFDNLFEFGFPSNLNMKNFYDNHIFRSDVLTDVLKGYMKYLLYEHEFNSPEEKHDYIQSHGRRTMDFYGNIYSKLESLGRESMTGLSLKQMLLVQDNETVSKALVKLKNPSKHYFSKIEDVYSAMDTSLKEMTGGPHNTIHTSFFGGLASKNQFRQMYGTLGYPSNLKNEIASTPITSSYVSGLRTTNELALNVKAAMIAAFFATTAIRGSEYYSRRMQSGLSSLRFVSTIDCGTTHGMPIEFIDDDMAKGMCYKTEDKPEWTLITEDHKPKPKENIILRNINHCLSPDGDTVCIKCAGEYAYHKPKEHYYGFWVMSKFTEINNQQSLSVKHYIASAVMSSIFLLSDSDNYTMNNRAVYLKNGNKLIIPMGSKDNRSFDGIQVIKNQSLDLKNITPAGISSINELIEIRDKNKVKITLNQEGYLSIDVLRYIQKNDCVYEDTNTIIIDLSNYDKNLPIVRFTAKAVNSKTIGESMQKLSLYSRTKGVSKTKQVLFDELRRLANPTLKVNYSILLSFLYVFSTDKDNTNDTRNKNMVDHDPQMESVDKYLACANTTDRILIGSDTTPLKPHEKHFSESSSSIISFISSYEDSMELIDNGRLL